MFACRVFFRQSIFFVFLKDIAAKQKAVTDIQRVIDEPAMGQSELDQLNRQVRLIMLILDVVLLQNFLERG